MATIELDIIKQRSDKLTPSEKRELIEYLTACLAQEELEPVQNLSGVDQTEDPDPNS